MEESTREHQQEHDDQSEKAASVTRPTVQALPVQVAYKTVKKHLHRSRPLAIAVFLIVTLAIGYLGGVIGARSENQNSLANVESKQIVLSTQGDIISNIAKTVGQSVVSIDVTATTTDASPGDNQLNNLFGFGGGTTTPQSTTEDSAGTGIILSSSGLIITNRHVIPDGTTNVTVTLSDGTTYSNVTVIGKTADNDSLDIAFLQIPNTNGHKLVPAILGDSSQMQVGDPVVAIGNALGQFQNTVTSGIISGYGRSVQASDSTGSVSENLADLFQTDAAINEGNSGGPLVNLSGQVIGINTALAENSQSIGFAIPINDVTGIIKSVESTGKLEQPYLGIIYIPITSDVASQYNLSVNNGAYIPSSSVVGEPTVVAGSPAASAGLQEGDIITKVNNTDINQTNDLTSVLDQQSVGDTVALTVIRDGKTMTINATLGSAPTN